MNLIAKIRKSRLFVILFAGIFLSIFLVSPFLSIPRQLFSWGTSMRVAQLGDNKISLEEYRKFIESANAHILYRNQFGENKVPDCDIPFRVEQEAWQKIQLKYLYDSALKGLKLPQLPKEECMALLFDPKLQSPFIKEYKDGEAKFNSESLALWMQEAQTSPEKWKTFQEQVMDFVVKDAQWRSVRDFCCVGAIRPDFEQKKRDATPELTVQSVFLPFSKAKTMFFASDVISQEEIEEHYEMHKDTYPTRENIEVAYVEYQLNASEEEIKRARQQVESKLKEYADSYQHNYNKASKSKNEENKRRKKAVDALLKTYKNEVVVLEEEKLPGGFAINEERKLGNTCMQKGRDGQEGFFYVKKRGDKNKHIVLKTTSVVYSNAEDRAEQKAAEIVKNPKITSLEAFMKYTEEAGRSTRSLHCYLDPIKATKGLGSREERIVKSLYKDGSLTKKPVLIFIPEDTERGISSTYLVVYCKQHQKKGLDPDTEKQIRQELEAKAILKKLSKEWRTKEKKEKEKFLKNNCKKQTLKISDPDAVELPLPDDDQEEASEAIGVVRALPEGQNTEWIRTNKGFRRLKVLEKDEKKKSSKEKKKDREQDAKRRNEFYLFILENFLRKESPYEDNRPLIDY